MHEDESAKQFDRINRVATSLYETTQDAPAQRAVGTPRNHLLTICELIA